MQNKDRWLGDAIILRFFDSISEEDLNQIDTAVRASAEKKLEIYIDFTDAKFETNVESKFVEMQAKHRTDKIKYSVASSVAAIATAPNLGKALDKADTTASKQIRRLLLMESQIPTIEEEVKKTIRETYTALAQAIGESAPSAETEITADLIEKKFAKLEKNYEKNSLFAETCVSKLYSRLSKDANAVEPVSNQARSKHDEIEAKVISYLGTKGIQ